MQRRTLIATAAAAAFAPRAWSAEPPVVLELFTSQGCSSCPPADALLGELAMRPGVIALAWHVDYWNGLGWRDPYATRLSTERQRAYADRLNEDVYTPALVVNGARLVIGSDRAAVQAAIEVAPRLPVAVAIARDAGNFTVSIAGYAAPVAALFAQYDPLATTAIGGGENGGRRLREYNIVRRAEMPASWDGTPRRLTLPAAAPGQGVAVLVQTADLRIVGAAELRATA